MRPCVRKVGVLLCAAIVGTWIYLASLPPLPRLCGFPSAVPIMVPRLQLRDGRYMAYKQIGVSRENATHKIIFVHGFGNSREDVVIADRFLSWTGDKALRELQEANISQQCFPILQACTTKAIRVASDTESGLPHLSGMATITLEGLFCSLSYFF